jgi:hypothetical protein
MSGCANGGHAGFVCVRLSMISFSSALRTGSRNTFTAATALCSGTFTRNSVCSRWGASPGLSRNISTRPVCSSVGIDGS